jgi:NADH-quinone oxidoreductase subunit J
MLNLFLLFSSYIVIVLKNPVESLLSLVITFITSSLIMLGLGAEFVFILLILVYLGAISVLFLFIIMLINIRMTELQNFYNNYKFILFFFCLAFFFLFIFFFFLYLIEKITYYEAALIIYFNWALSLFQLNNLTIVGQYFFILFYDYFFLLILILLVALLGTLVLLQKSFVDIFYKITTRHLKI